MGQRKVGAVVALVGVVVAVGACGGGEGAGGGGTLDVFIGANTQFAGEQQAWFAKTAEKFKQQTGATVRFETFSSGNDEQTKIQTSVVSGTGPDVYTIGTTFTPTAYSTGAFVTLGDEEWKAVGGREKFTPATLGISGPDGQNQIGVPFVSRPFVMAYNTEILQKAGLRPATSWDELTAQAKQLTKDDQWGLAVAYKDNFDPWKFVWGMSIQAGNPLVEGKVARLADPAVARAYQTFFGWLATDRVVDPAAVGWTNPQALAAFGEGKTAYFAMTSALAVRALDRTAVKGKYALALLPTVPPGATARPANGVEAASILSGDNVVVADYSKNKELAFKFVKLLTDKDEQLEQWKTFGQLPANAEAAATLTGDKQLGPVLEAAAKSSATPFTGAWGDIQLALTNAVVQTLPELARGPVDPAKIDGRLAAAQKTAQSALDRAK
jgi:multiple sugar transport system substrate-binding protein